MICAAAPMVAIIEDIQTRSYCPSITTGEICADHQKKKKHTHPVISRPLGWMRQACSTMLQHQSLARHLCGEGHDSLSSDV
eukprot:scaffold28581_cov47-Prasinocladus_malaysianus.AAC.1